MELQTPGPTLPADGDIVPELRNWIDIDLAASTQTHKFVFVHEPAFPANRHVGDSLDLYPANRDAFVYDFEQPMRLRRCFAGTPTTTRMTLLPSSPCWVICSQITNGTLQGTDGGATITYVLVDGPTATYTVYHRAIGSPSFTLRDTWVTGAAPTCYALTLGHTGKGSDPVASPA